MKHSKISPATTIAEILALSPEMASLFIYWRTDCLGCSMARFCTLQEMCMYYGLELKEVINSVSERIRRYESNPPSD